MPDSIELHLTEEALERLHEMWREHCKKTGTEITLDEFVEKVTLDYVKDRLSKMN